MRYFKQLDGLRMLAVALVLLHHFAPHIGHAIAAGYLGVELFFVLSGFLITRILYQARGSMGSIYRQFVGRRALRIFPIYYLVFIVLLLAGEPSARQYWLPLVSYTFNYTMAARQLSGIPFIHTWSLCVEEQFYLLWPFIIVALRSRYRLLLAVLAAIVLAGWAQMLFNVVPMRPGFTAYGLFPRAYALALGGLAALLCQRHAQPARWLQAGWPELPSLALLGAV
ncbi:MAG: acyltransferase, partial [Chitinophagaceae bacterium]|nr:acyltransferase [Chitinophagaceae bacterium]